MKRLGCLGFTILLVAVICQSAFAWELNLKGDLEWRYRYWARTGSNDIFGLMDSNPANLGINHLRTYPTQSWNNRVATGFGVLAGENCYGADMTLNDYRMTLYPVIRVNPAISISASVNLTSLGIWSDGQPYRNPVVEPVAAGTPLSLSQPGWVNSLYAPIGDPPAGTNVPNTFVTLQWLALGIQTPVMNFSIGYRYTQFGIGLWKHRDGSPSTSFSVTAPWGPLLIQFAPYFSRNLSDWRDAGGTTTAASLRQRNEGAASQQRQEDRRNYFAAPMFGGGVVYNNGPLQIAYACDAYREPSAPRVTARTSVTVPAGLTGLALPTPGAITVANPSQDVIRYRQGLALKYNNGRFFFNGEVDNFSRWRSGIATATGVGAAGRVNVGVDDSAWLYGTEFGALCGATKATLSYVRATGDDPSTRKTNEDAMTAENISTGLFLRHWGYLMYYMYGTGDGFTAEGYGNPTNFHHVGARIDQALASNLNFFAVYSQAWRDQPNAYRLGGDYLQGARIWSNTDTIGAGLNQAVPDSARDIGWELDLGLNWKLLENFTWNTTFAFWKPGNWWSYAYPNTAWLYALSGAVAPATAGVNTRANATFGAGRQIDPLIAVETNILVSF